MKRLHIFNPEHDIALASGLRNFTAPHAGRQLRHDLGVLPVIWAQEGDGIFVDDLEASERALRRLSQHGVRPLDGVRLLTRQDITREQLSGILPWGWDPALKGQLLRLGVSENVVPTDNTIDLVRELSHRRVAAKVLAMLPREKWCVGESTELFSLEDVKAQLNQYNQIVLKAPWSSSGRGIRFVTQSSIDNHVQGWIKNVLLSQGSVMAEPYYHKLKDFGMEFEANAQGHVSYLGLSLFHTQNGAYTGNLIVTERIKTAVLQRYVDRQVLELIRQSLCSCLEYVLDGRYEGPLGVDMMLIRGDGEKVLIHPCVEINLRRTMGHVALALLPRLNPDDDDEKQMAMRILCEDNQYKMKIGMIKVNY